MEKMSKNKEINWEKIGSYFACIGFIYILIQSQIQISEKISDLRERIAVVEVYVKILQEN